MALSALLTEQQAAKYDVVLPARQIASGNGHLYLTTDESSDRFQISNMAVEGLAEKLEIPVRYLRTLHADRPDLFDANVNGWLHGGGGVNGMGFNPTLYPADDRKLLVRCFKAVEGPGIARAVLSDGFRFIDHLDSLTALLEGVQATGQEVTVERCDLSERRMYVKLACPAIRALAPALLERYRSPFDQGITRPWETEAGLAHGYLAPEDQTVVEAGLVASNSETGGGAWTIAPSIRVKICKNGLTISLDALRIVHLGARLDEGVVQWSAETQLANVDLIRSMAKDAVTAFLSQDYLDTKVAEIEAQAGHPVTNAEETIREVTAQLRIPEARRIDVLTHFIMGGQMTAGGVLQAVTSVAQTLPDADEAYAMEAMGVRALELATRV
jgi:hypothetical protein